MQEIQFIAPAALHDEMLRLRNEKQMDFLESLTGMDWGVADEKDAPEKLRGLGVVYHLESTITGERIALKTATTNRELPEIPSVSDIWKIADFYEREVFDFYGITFVGHPDMRRLYLRNDWIGYPMRKDNDPEKDNPLCMTNEETFDTTQEIELNPDGTIKNKETKLFGEEEYVVNIGPQHPATHGVMRFRVSLEGEIIRKIDANCGYIHRGIEKMNESLTYPQTLALTDRLDYLGAHQNRHALCMCIEKAMGVEVSERVKYIRTIMDELQRIDSHLLFYSCLAMDLGALTAFFYGFRDREKILDIFEETCGGRLIMNYNTIGGVQVTVGAPQAVRSLGGLGGGSVVQHAVLLGKLLFHGSIVLNGAGRQLGNVVTADGGDILAVDRAGAGGLQHGLDVGRGLAGGQLRNTGGGVVGVVLGQQIDACRDLDPADGADGGRRGHGTASQRQHHGNSHSKAEQFGFNGTHELVLPFMIGFAAQRRSINAIIPHFCRYCKPRGGVIYL